VQVVYLGGDLPKALVRGVEKWDREGQEAKCYQKRKKKSCECYLQGKM